jgi:hypothetical protein
VGGQRHAPVALPPGKTRYPLYRKLGGPESRSGLVRIISNPPGFDPRTFHPVASRYIDCTIHAAITLVNVCRSTVAKTPSAVSLCPSQSPGGRRMKPRYKLHAGGGSLHQPPSKYEADIRIVGLCLDGYIRRKQHTAPRCAPGSQKPSCH